MKQITLLSLILGITLLFSCKTTEEPTPKTLIGTWSFSSDNTSGEFTITKIAGKEKINAGYFTVQGNTYTIDQSTEFDVSLSLVSSNFSLNLLDFQVDTNYTTITSETVVFNKPGVPSTIYHETITCTKQ